MPKAFEFGIKQVIRIFQPLKWYKAPVITAVFNKCVMSIQWIFQNDDILLIN